MARAMSGVDFKRSRRSSRRPHVSQAKKKRHRAVGQYERIHQRGRQARRQLARSSAGQGAIHRPQQAMIALALQGVQQLQIDPGRRINHHNAFLRAPFGSAQNGKMLDLGQFHIAQKRRDRRQFKARKRAKTIQRINFQMFFKIGLSSARIKSNRGLRRNGCADLRGDPLQPRTGFIRPSSSRRSETRISRGDKRVSSPPDRCRKGADLEITGGNIQRGQRHLIAFFALEKRR